MKSYMKVSIVCFLMSGCTTQITQLTSLSDSRLEHYKDRNIDEFIWNRYVMNFERMGFGYLYKGIDAAVTKLDSVSSKDKTTFMDLKKEYSLYVAHYNLENYADLVRPKKELERLCAIQGGSLVTKDIYRLNIPRAKLDSMVAQKFENLSNQYRNAEDIAAQYNSYGERFQITDELSVPIVMKAEFVRNEALKELDRLHVYQEIRRSSDMDVMLKGDLAISGDRAFQYAIEEGSFGLFNCQSNGNPIWSVQIKGMWSDVKHQAATSYAVFQIVGVQH